MAEPEHDDPDQPDERRRGIARFADIEFVDPDPDGSDEPSDEQRRRNNRILTLAIAVGAVVVVAIAVIGVFAVRHYLDNTSSVTAQMSRRYHAQYRGCVERGADRTLCATRAEVACAADAGWSADSHRLDDIADTCRFGDNARP